jgi:DNA modification methylase
MGIEKEKEYYEIAKARIESYKEEVKLQNKIDVIQLTLF